MGKGRGGFDSRGGRGGGGEGEGVIVMSETSLVSAREGRQAEVDQTLGVLRDVNEKYGAVAEDLSVVQLDAKNANCMAYYRFDEDSISVNRNYFKNIDGAYDRAVEQGFHPARGNKSGLEATIAHEAGHMVTARIGERLGSTSTNQAAEVIVKRAAASGGYRSFASMANKVSKYAGTNYAELVAESFTDVYCNGTAASAVSRTIMGVVDSYF